MEKTGKNEGREVGAIKYSPGWPGEWGSVDFRIFTSPGGDWRHLGASPSQNRNSPASEVTHITQDSKKVLDGVLPDAL